jgi:hypothetical protein
VSRRIFVCTTFRSFDGSRNDQIQRYFLESLRRQTYDNWELVVTIFREQNVEQTLHELDIPYSAIYTDPGEFKFSLTDVLLNGIDRARDLGPNSAVLLWSTCDVVLPPAFFETIDRHFSPGIAGTSHPHVESQSLEEFESGTALYSYPHGLLSLRGHTEGIDLLYFDADIFLAGGGERLVREYRFVDWGLFEHFLVGLAVLCAQRRVNLWSYGAIGKIANDREPGNETIEWLRRCWDRNYVPIKRFIDETAANEQILSLHYCHKQFALLAKPSYYRRFIMFHGRRVFQRRQSWWVGDVTRGGR